MVIFSTMSRRVRRSLVAVVATAAIAVTFCAVASPASAGSPFGQVTNNYQGTLFGYAAGWAVDPDAFWLPIDVRVDATYYKTSCWWGRCFSRVVDSYSWQQTANYYNDTMLSDPTYQLLFGPYHGFNMTLVRPPTIVTYDYATACVTAINVGDGSDTSLGCYNLSVLLT